MTLFNSLPLALALCTAGLPAWSTDLDHQAHHPAGIASAPAAKAVPSTAGVETAQVDAELKAMHQMHDRMMAAKTFAERNELMAVHMKVMQDGMSLMNGMSSGAMKGGMKGGMATHRRTMEQRMDVMQMMMDRLSAAAPK
jgi:hypothetical protein